jgi:hypothetical protein
MPCEKANDLEKYSSTSTTSTKRTNPLTWTILLKIFFQAQDLPLTAHVHLLMARSLAHEIASPKLRADNKTCITQIKLKLLYSAWQNHADLHKTT